MCTGFDEDDAEVDLAQEPKGVLNLPESFVEDTRQIVTFRYKNPKQPEHTFILKMVP